MTATELGTTKRGATFEASIAVTIDDAAQDFTEADWSVTAQAKLTAEASSSVDFTIDDGDLENSIVTVTLDPDTTLAMTAGTYLVDVRIEDPTGRVYISDTYELIMEAAVTEPPEAP